MSSVRRWIRRRDGRDTTNHAAIGEPSTTLPTSRWLTAEENIWPVPVIDVRPFTQTMWSTSQNPEAATNALSFGRDDGFGFVDQKPPIDRTTSLDLRYQVDSDLEDGPLFIPREMEYKWAIFVRHGLVLFVRSWTREVHIRVRARVDDGSLILTEAIGAVLHPEEADDFTAASVDFLVRSHVLDEVVPAPLPPEIGDVARAELWSFSVYGRKAQFATPHRFESAPSLGIVRNASGDQ